MFNVSRMARVGASLLVTGVLILPISSAFAASKKAESPAPPPASPVGALGGPVVGLGSGLGGFCSPGGYMGCAAPIMPGMSMSADSFPPGEESCFPGPAWGASFPQARRDSKPFLIRYRITATPRSGRGTEITSGTISVSGDETPSPFESIKQIPYIQAITKTLSSSGQVVTVPTAGEVRVGIVGAFSIRVGKKDTAINYCVRHNSLSGLLSKDGLQKPNVETLIDQQGVVFIENAAGREGHTNVSLGSRKGTTYSMALDVKEFE